MAFVFWGQLAFWLGAKFWTIAYPSLLWQSLTTSNCFHLLKQQWRQLLQLAGLKNSSQRCTGHFINYSQSLQRHGQLPACWTMERKHKDIRKHGNGLCNTTHWETSLIKSVIAEHIYTLGEESSLFREGTCLQNAKGAHREDDGIPMQCWRGSCGNALQAELLLQTFFWGNNYFWWCCLFAQCGWRLTSFQCSSRALFFESPLW